MLLKYSLLNVGCDWGLFFFKISSLIGKVANSTGKARVHPRNAAYKCGGPSRIIAVVNPEFSVIKSESVKPKITRQGAGIYYLADSPVSDE